MKLPANHSEQFNKPEPYFMSLPQVLKRLGISKSSFYDGIKHGKYPKMVKLGSSSRWLNTAIDQVIENALNSK